MKKGKGFRRERSLFSLETKHADLSALGHSGVINFIFDQHVIVTRFTDYVVSGITIDDDSFLAFEFVFPTTWVTIFCLFQNRQDSILIKFTFCMF